MSNCFRYLNFWAFSFQNFKITFGIWISGWGLNIFGLIAHNTCFWLFGILGGLFCIFLVFRIWKLSLETEYSLFGIYFLKLFYFNPPNDCFSFFTFRFFWALVLSFEYFDIFFGTRISIFGGINLIHLFSIWDPFNWVFVYCKIISCINFHHKEWLLYLNLNQLLK